MLEIRFGSESVLRDSAIFRMWVKSVRERRMLCGVSGYARVIRERCVSGSSSSLRLGDVFVVDLGGEPVVWSARLCQRANCLYRCPL